MYESFFGLHEKPFSLLPDPGFFYLSKIHREALTLVEYGLYNQSGFTVLTGEIGSGKTTLMRYLLDRLDQELTVGLISHTHQSLGQIMDWICVAFDLKVPAGDRIAQHQAFVDFLLGEYRKGKKTLLIIDEAQNLGLEKLEEIRLLSNINADKDLVFQLLLLGQPQLREQLRAPELEQFIQRISASYHLGRLNAEETFYYIRHRLKIAGGDKAIFTPDACHAIYHYSKGIPRVINLICETALVFSYGAGETTITGKAIDEFIKLDSSHLLFAVDHEERIPLPEYQDILAGATGPDVEARPADQTPDPERLATPAFAAVAHPPEHRPEPPSNDAEHAQRASDRPTSSDAETVLPLDQDAARQPEETSEISIVERIEASSPRRRWTGEFGAIAAGLLMGLGLVGWFFYQPNTPSESSEAGPATETETTGIANTPAPQAPDPVIAAPVTAPPVETGSNALDTPRAPAAQTTQAQPTQAQPGVLGADQQLTTLASPTPETGPNQNLAPPVQAEPQETPTPGAPPVAEAVAETKGEGEAAMTDLERDLAGLSIDVERLGPRQLRADFSQHIQFKDGSTTLKPEAKALLEQFAMRVRESDKVRIAIAAHTDSKGSKTKNQALSEQRAAIIAQILAQAGVPEGRLSHVGKGETEPKISPDQERLDGPWINRRIEIDLTE